MISSVPALEPGILESAISTFIWSDRCNRGGNSVQRRLSRKLVAELHRALMVAEQQATHDTLIDKFISIDTQKSLHQPRFETAWHDADYLQQFALTRREA